MLYYEIFLVLLLTILSNEAKIASIDSAAKLGKEEWKIRPLSQEESKDEKSLSPADDNLPEPDDFPLWISTVNADKLKFYLKRKDNLNLWKSCKKSSESSCHMRNLLQWMDFKHDHSKKYKTLDEDRNRFQIFVDNLKHIRLHNGDFEKQKHSYKLNVNKYSDMTHEEFITKMNGFKRNASNMLKSTASNFLAPLNFVAPREVDWRQQDYVTPVKDQGHCGSCWAFSTTGSLEGQHKRQTGKLISLSEQNLVDCSFKFGNEGCNGGLMDNAFKYIKQNGGVDTETSYPYEAKEGKCRFKKSSVGAEDKGFVDLPQGNETALLVALASQGPISVAIDAGHRSFQFYSHGIYFEPNCSSTELDHGVLAVGYGTLSDGHDYWLVKNSWGISWGEDGYVKIARNRHNHCGISTQASYPTV